MQYLFLDESGNLHKNSPDRFFVIGGIFTNNYTDIKKSYVEINKELKENKIENKYGIEYTKQGDYYMPNLVLEKEKIMLNKYGRMRLKFLKENKKAEYTIMFVNGTLNKHLKEIQETAQSRIDIIIEQLKQQNNLTEEMKNTDQLYWVSMMNNFKSTAEEIILKELIYV